MKILCLIPLCFLVLINAEQQLVGQKPRLVEKGITAVTGSCTIEKNLFYPSSGTFYTTIKLGDCDTKLKAELISSSVRGVFNQCAIKPNCSSSANIGEDNYNIPVWNSFFSGSEVSGSLVSDYINWGCLLFRRNWLGFAVSPPGGSSSFFSFLINSGVIGNPTLCLSVKSSCNFNSEDEAAGKLLLGKSISEVFSNSYARFNGLFNEWRLQVTAASICDESIFLTNTNILINTSTPYIVMDKGSYVSFLNKLQNNFGVECLDDGPTTEGYIDVCYLDCAIARKLPRIGLTLSSYGGAAPTVEYFLKNNLVKFGGEDSNGQCSLAIAGRTLTDNINWSLGTSFFNGRTVCFENVSGDTAVYIGSSGL